MESSSCCLALRKSLSSYWQLLPIRVESERFTGILLNPVEVFVYVVLLLRLRLLLSMSRKRQTTNHFGGRSQLLLDGLFVSLNVLVEKAGLFQNGRCHGKSQLVGWGIFAVLNTASPSLWDITSDSSLSPKLAPRRCVHPLLLVGHHGFVSALVFTCFPDNFVQPMRSAVHKRRRDVEFAILFFAFCNSLHLV